MRVKMPANALSLKSPRPAWLRRKLKPCSMVKSLEIWTDCREPPAKRSTDSVETGNQDLSVLVENHEKESKGSFDQRLWEKR